MTPRCLIALSSVLFACLFTGCATGPQHNPNGAIMALENLPGKYRTSVVRLYADTAIPTPPTWYILARNYNVGDKLFLVTMKKGMLWHQTPAPQKELTAQPKSQYFVNRHQVMVDSDGAWNAAAKFSASKGSQLANAKMALHQRDASSAPIWSVQCYDPKNIYIGKIIISAATGAVLSSR